MKTLMVSLALAGTVALVGCERDMGREEPLAPESERPGGAVMEEDTPGYQTYESDESEIEMR